MNIPNVMTPLKLEVLLYYYWSPKEWPDAKISNASGEAHIWLTENGLLDWKEGRYKISDKGQVHIKNVLALSFPELKWV